jgi:hypothetical protein
MMKKLMLLIVAVIISLTMSGIVPLSHASGPTPPPPAAPTPETQSPPMLDTKPELATPQPKAPMDLKVPGASDVKVEPKEGKTKSNP